MYQQIILMIEKQFQKGKATLLKKDTPIVETRTEKAEKAA